MSDSVSTGNDEIEIMDLSDEPSDNRSNYTLSFKEKPYNSAPKEDIARIIISISLIGILAFIIIWATCATIKHPESKDSITEVLQLILGPLIALVSAATGFYFGSKK